MNIARLDFPMEQRFRMMVDSEQIQTALEAFESRLSENGRPRIKSFEDSETLA